MKGIIVFFLFIVIMLNGCASIRGFTRQNTEERPPDFGTQCSDISPKRGLAVDFVENAPPSELSRGQRFPISLKFANYNKDPIYADLIVQDDSGTSDFKTINAQVTVKEATYQNNRLAEPGCRTVAEDLPKMHLGLFSYNMDVNRKIRFIAKVSYNYVSTVAGNICVFNPILGGASGCSEKESLSGAALGTGAIFDPVTVTRIDKAITGIDRDQVLLTLDIYLKDLVADGIIDTKNQKMNFQIDIEELPMECRIRKAAENVGETGTQLEISLDKKEAIINCESLVNIDRMKQVNFEMKLDYRYSYFARKNVNYQGLQA